MDPLHQQARGLGLHRQAEPGRCPPLGDELEAHISQVSGQVRIAVVLEPVGQQAFQVGRFCGKGSQQISLLVAPAPAAEVLPELADHHGKGTALATQVQVEHQGNHGPLEVVTDLAVAGVGIGPVELHPGLLAALAQALDLAPGGQQVAAEVLAQVLQQLGFRAQTRRERQELVQIAGDPFSKPEARHHHGLVVIDRGEFGGPQPPHIPLMQVFVGDELQKLAVAGWGLQAGAAVNQHTAVVVLEPAIALIKEMQDEQVGVAGRGRDSHQPAAGFSRGLHIGQQGRAMVLQPILGASGAFPGDPTVGHARHGKAVAAVGPQL